VRPGSRISEGHAKLLTAREFTKAMKSPTSRPLLRLTQEQACRHLGPPVDLNILDSLGPQREVEFGDSTKGSLHLGSGRA
jgi:hypothetical protein